MVPIPAVIYNQLTFPLQLLASRAAEGGIDLLQIPVIREGNVLILPQQNLNVVEACSGIRSLLTLTFFSLVYGYFFEKRTWVRVVLFFSTIPDRHHRQCAAALLSPALFPQIQTRTGRRLVSRSPGNG